jgi:hypothetical protein
MGRWRLISMAVAAVAAPAVYAGAVSPVAVPPLAASGAIAPGSWNIVFDDGTARRICLQDIQLLIQLAHAGPACGRLIIQDEPDRATVHYTCPGAGWGRTSLLVETPRLVRINSQGIAGKMPFAFDAEARRVGDCEGSALRRPR